MGHDHVIVFAATTGTWWLWTVHVLAVVTATSGAFLRPIRPLTGGQAAAGSPRIAAGAAAAIVVAELLLAGALALPEQLVAFVVLASVAAAGSTGVPPGAAWVTAVRVVAPWVVAVATSAAVTATVLGQVHTALFVGAAGLAWLGPATPRTRRGAVIVDGVGWIAGLVVLGAASTAAVAALP